MIPSGTFLSRRLVFRELDATPGLTLFRRSFSRSNLFKSWKNRWKLPPKPRHIIPLGLSAVFIYYFRFSPDDTEKAGNVQYNPEKRWRVKLYRTVPWRPISRAWGWLCKIHLPLWSRNYLLSWYISKYGVDLSEAEQENVEDYKSLAELFGRKLKPNARQIHSRSSMVSPCDGIVLHFGKVEESGQLEQVKGITYPLAKFLGPTIATQDDNVYSKHDAGKSLFFCVIYLAPGDYHGFHSPVKWEVTMRRHFRGDLLSVKPSVANWIPIFVTNERVCYIGRYAQGFFSMTAVGALNVGSIQVYKDPDLTTNSSKKWKQTSTNEKYFQDHLTFVKGSPFGEFHLGSTIVLVFEANNQFRFALKYGQRIKFGQTLI